MTTGISIQVAPGELLDKITILEIKAERLRAEDQLRNVQRELSVLLAARRRHVPELPVLVELEASLRQINERLWDIEDEIRDCERRQDFGPPFIELARSVYRTNDRRAELKRRINLLLHSPILEEKSYTDYQSEGDGVAGAEA